MLTTLDRYILRQILVSSAAMLGIALCALLLERLIRLLDLSVNPDRVMGYVSQMMVSLIPHYLGLALPLAFFLGVLLTFNRLSRDNELAVMTAAGRGLVRIVAPAMGLALILTAVAAVTFSYLQPLARYSYRALVHAVEHASLSAAVEGRTFVHIDGMTFIAEDASPGGRHLSNVFVYEQAEDGRSLVTTAQDATLIKAPDRPQSVLVLDQGQRTEFRTLRDGLDNLTFDAFHWPLVRSSDERFRARGKDEREMTLWELWNRATPLPAKVSVDEARSELHARLVGILTILVLPLLAVPLAVGGGRGGQSYGIALGLLLLVFYNKVVTFGEAMASDGHIAPWVGLWLPFGVFTAGGAYLFYRAALTVPSGTFGAPPAPRDLYLLFGRRLGPRRRRAV